MNRSWISALRVWGALVALSGPPALMAEDSLAPDAASDAVAPPDILLVGTFPEWTPGEPGYRMEFVGEQRYRLQRFLRAGKYQFRVGSGDGATTLETVPVLTVTKPGGYLVDLDLALPGWQLADAELDAPAAVVDVLGPVEANIPVTLDASGSQPRRGMKLFLYEFGQQPGDRVPATLTHPGLDVPQATVVLPREGTYQFWLRVNDGIESESALVTLTVARSYQLVGKSTGDEPSARATWMQPDRPGEYVRVLPSPAPGQHQLILVRNHDPAEIVAHLTVDVALTNGVVWVARYHEAENRLTCAPEALTEFVFDPQQYPLLANHKVRTVQLAGSFNNWNPAATSLAPTGDGRYSVFLKLDDGLHHYKFVVNGEFWLQDLSADPECAASDGRGGLNSGVFVGEQGTAFGVQPLGEINRAALRHQPDQPRYFYQAGEFCEVTLRTLLDDARQVTLSLVDGGAASIPLRRVATERGFDYWQATFPAPPAARQLTYYFTLIDGATTMAFGRAVDETAPMGVVPFTVPLAARRFTPAWAQHVVWYQVLLERFANGNPTNDLPQTLPWTWNWYKAADWEQAAAAGTIPLDWYSRRFGGDLQGLISRLPYFRELGVTALLVGPVFDATSYHGGDTTDYRHIAPSLGDSADNAAIFPAETLAPDTWQWTKTDRLFLEFLERAHAQGLKVVLEVAFTHMGKGSFALQDVLTNGVQSAYADWFEVTDWGPPVHYGSRDGGGWLPQLRKDDRHGFASASLRRYLDDITRRWMDPNGDGDPADGIDGWRLVGAREVPAAFWTAWRQRVKAINPQAFLIGDQWDADGVWTPGAPWDAILNEPLAACVDRHFGNPADRLRVGTFDQELRELLDRCPAPVNLVLPTGYDSRDTARLVSRITHPDAAATPDTPPDRTAWQALKLMVTVQLTFPGAPLIWYGDEAGMWGAAGPANSKPMRWRDQPAPANPHDRFREEVWEHYRRLIAIRNAYPVLRTGAYEPWFTDDDREVFGFLRGRDQDKVAILLNASADPQPVELAAPFPEGAQVVDLLAAAPVQFVDLPLRGLEFPGFPEGATVRALKLGEPVSPVFPVRGGKLRLTLSPRSAVILAQP